MRRMIAGVKKALHQNKAKDKQPQNEIQSIQANEAMIAVAKAQLSALSMPAPSQAASRAGILINAVSAGVSWTHRLYWTCSHPNS